MAADEQTHLLGQADHDVRLDWGPIGAAATGADVCVVVDVLSFSTSVSVAVDRGTEVLPYAWRGPDAQEYAARHDAVLAVGRLESLRDGTVVAPSLSPAGLLAADPLPRLVLPSPNGSTIAALARDRGATVVAGCLRNAGAVAGSLAEALGAHRSIAVVAAGERWPDGSLRPALEDHLGAGAILSALLRLAPGARPSPEAAAAATLFESARDRVPQWLGECVGSRELAGKGFAEDVEIASALDATGVVPVLVDAAFVAAPGGRITVPA